MLILSSIAPNSIVSLESAVIVQTVENGEWAFLMAMGTVIKKTLGDGEQILVDGNSILCFESSVTVDVRPIGSIAAMCCGGEGLFNTELTGAFHSVSLRCMTYR